MSEQITISFVATAEIKSWLQAWSEEDDRSVSYIMRQILKQEAQRRAQTHPNQQPSRSLPQKSGDYDYES